MITRWNRKRKKFEENKNKRIMRIKQRKNRCKKYACMNMKEIYNTNKVFHFLKGKNFGEKKNDSWTNNLKRKVCIPIPKSFSVSENPDETLQTLKELFFYGSNLKIHEIEIDYSECINLEIAASAIMDIIVLAIREYHRKNKSEIYFSGQIPPQGRVKDIFMPSGLASHMKISMSTEVSVDRDKMKLFKMKSGYHKSCNSDKTATDLTEYIIQCMNTQGYTLNDMGRNYLGVLFGEVLDNCEIHGGSDCTWFAHGHYQLSSQSNYCGEVQLVIFNFGNTIYEQMNSSHTTAETKEKLQYLNERHQKFFGKEWDVEMLYTLFSLQEGISRLRDQEVPGNRKRGMGTVRLIENFQKIGQTHLNRKPLMTITSGHTHIVFDGKYSLKSEEFHDRVLGIKPRRIIAFNSENDIFLPPDTANVRKTKLFFPGTIISLDFFFDKEYFKSMVN